MENPKNIKTPGQTPSVPTDKGEDSEERRDAAEQAWRDKQGIPRGTPEQGERSADRVGGGGPAQPEPEIEDDSNRSTTKRVPGADDDQADKRRASTDDDTDSV
jgi:hypothetical protein